jgi:hypothetical protein
MIALPRRRASPAEAASCSGPACDEIRVETAGACVAAGPSRRPMTGCVRPRDITRDAASAVTE